MGSSFDGCRRAYMARGHLGLVHLAKSWGEGPPKRKEVRMSEINGIAVFLLLLIFAGLMWLARK